MNNDELTIFVSSPDSYSDVFLSFYNTYLYFSKPNNLKFYLSTQCNKYDNLSGIEVFNTNNPNDTWTERAIFGLNKIESKYVLLICDDMIIKKEIDYLLLEEIVNEMEQYSIMFCGLRNRFNGKKLYKKSKIHLVKRNKAYSRNLQIGIYNRKYLLDVLGDGSKSPWKIELEWLDEACKSKNIYFDDICSTKTKPIECVNGVQKGMWFKSSYDYLKKKGFLVEHNRNTISRFKEFRGTFFRILGKIIPAKYRPGFKRFFKKIGIKFYSDK